MSIKVVERTPLVAVKASGGYLLVDHTGVGFETASLLPAGAVEVGIASGNAPLLVDSGTIVSALPNALRDQVATITADAPDSFRVHLDSGLVVTWGSADESALKGQVALLLLKQKPKAIDVPRHRTAPLSADPPPSPRVGPCRPLSPAPRLSARSGEWGLVWGSHALRLSARSGEWGPVRVVRPSFASPVRRVGPGFGSYRPSFVSPVRRVGTGSGRRARRAHNHQPEVQKCGRFVTSPACHVRPVGLCQNRSHNLSSDVASTR